MKTNIRIDTASPQDAAACLKIYKPYVTDTAISFEYEVPTEEEFRRRITETLKKYPYLVAREGETIIGYAYCSPFKTRKAYDYCVETSIYVDLEKRKSGVGRMLYEALEKALWNMGILNVNACIAYPMEEMDPYVPMDSILFHEKMGYETVARFHKCGYKFERWYDMVWMEKMLGEHVKNPQEIVPYTKEMLL